MTFKTLLDKYRVTIPIIQRDYAQGRDDKKVTVIRKELLTTIKNALNDVGDVDFDFVYGSVKDGELLPLDGQQRLTTLFLLHWYLAYKSRRVQEIGKLLDGFSYQTRISSSRFCNKLIVFEEPCDTPIKSWVMDQPWFADSWSNDPTITAMLCMLESMEAMFDKNYNTYLDKLLYSEVIHFQFLDMDGFNLTDNLYIKMNARGKCLSDFENFKARFEKNLNNRPEFKNRFVSNIDSRWTELLWGEMRNNLDNGFMNYFNYISEVGFHLYNGIGAELPKENDMNFKFEVFSRDDILDLLFTSLDRWSQLKPADYFDSYFTSNEYAEGKVKLYEENVNLFNRCINATKFVAKDKLMLYAVILQLISGDEQRDNLRLVRNLLENSPFEIRAENMHNLYCSIQMIMSYNTFDYNDLKTAFSGPQVDDEIEKQKFIENNTSLKGVLYHFEDHYILKGRMSSITLNPDTLEAHRVKFKELFAQSINRVDISRALLCFGDYRHNDSTDRWRFANSDDTWHAILTLKDRSKIKAPLAELLDALQSRTIEKIIIDELDNLERQGLYSWIYYFIKYPEMNSTSGNRRGANYVWRTDFDICMLNTTRLSGYWRDPYLWCIYTQLSEEERQKVSSVWNIGNVKTPLIIDGISLSINKNGNFIVSQSSNESDVSSKYISVCSQFLISNEVLRVDNDDLINVGRSVIKAILTNVD